MPLGIHRGSEGTTDSAVRRIGFAVRFVKRAMVRRIGFDRRLADCTFRRSGECATLWNADRREDRLRGGGRAGGVVTYAFQKAAPGVFKTMMGTSVEEAVSRAVAAGAGIVGANCGTSLDLDDYVELGKELTAAAGTTPVALQPNAAAPRMVGEETVYDATPGQMASAARELLQVGVRIVGGCCGTTPEHLATVAAAVRQG